MSAPPYMKLYIADYLADTTHLTCEQHGAYLLLLMAMWRAGGKLPNKDPKLAAIVKKSASEWAKIRPELIGLFQVRGGSITHKRLRKEMAHYETVSLNRQRAQKRSHSENDNENNENPPPVGRQKKGKRPHNQNQNQKVSLEASKKASKSNRSADASEARHEGASSLPRTVIPYDELRERIAREQAEMAAKERA